MSFLTQPTRVNELSVDTVQDATASRCSFRVASTGTANFDGNAVFDQDVDLSAATFKPRLQVGGSESFDSTELQDGEAAFLAPAAGSSEATLQIRSGATMFFFSSSTENVH